ncbi:hypothetical protein ykris0001_31360 [Yersinia kristensenii ATCC 33638]|nr:hypothetical protein ykris0001_31360 [Yersinia kristensenii ATCC 33638]
MHKLPLIFPPPHSNKPYIIKGLSAAQLFEILIWLPLSDKSAIFKNISVLPSDFK